MKAKLAVFALGALVLMANGANAQHRTSGQTHVRHLSRISGHAYGYASREATPGGIFGQPYGYAPREPTRGLIFGPEQPMINR
jgi:hypothetical protein